MDNECKAWEPNVDATYEGNNRDGGCAPNNWGSCGFQRHFPWKEFTLAGEAEALSMDNFGGLDFNTAPGVGAFDAGNAFLTTTSTLYNVGGLPFLGGICKLSVSTNKETPTLSSLPGLQLTALLFLVLLTASQWSMSTRRATTPTMLTTVTLLAKVSAAPMAAPMCSLAQTHSHVKLVLLLALPTGKHSPLKVMLTKLVRSSPVTTSMLSPTSPTLGAKDLENGALSRCN